MELSPGENVFYPMPYVEGEAHLLVITNQRVLHFGDAGKQEMPAKQIQFVGRMSGRPYVVLGVVLALLVALPLVGAGIYYIVTSGVLSSKMIPIAPPGDDPGGDPAAGGGEGDDGAA